MGEGPVAGIVLAAGAGERFGRPKAFVSLDGELLADRAARGLAEAGCRPVLVVLGAGERPAGWRPAPGVAVVDNPGWAEGMGSSLRAALAAVRELDAAAALVTLVDLPGVGAPAHARVLAARGAPAQAVVATYRGRRGHPVLFEAAAWPGLGAGLAGDVGARDWLAAHPDLVREVDCSDVADPSDVDRPADLPAAGG